MNINKEVGRWGEEIASAYLKRKGYIIIDRNFYTPEGEIDLIASLEENGERVLIFVEVKTRTSEKYGYPEEAFTQKKWDHILKAIDRYLLNHPDFKDPWQVDVIAIQRLNKDAPLDIEHFENVVMNHDKE